MLAGASLAVHLPEVKAASDALAPGVGGAALLLLAQLAYVPNAIIWAVAYTARPRFRVRHRHGGRPDRVGPRRGAALPDARGHAGRRAGRAARAGYSVAVLALPYLAGVFAGVVTVRIAPTPVIEAAPLWGFAAGTAAGVLAGLAAAFSGGPLGNGRLASVGPSGFQVGLVAILELGITAALSAAAAELAHPAPRPEEVPRDRPGRPAAAAGPAPAPGPARRDRRRPRTPDLRQPVGRRRVTP